MNLEVFPSRIIGVQFGTSSYNDIVSTSVCEVTEKDTQPTKNGLMSPYMGPTMDPATGRSAVCPIDGLLEDRSPGYFGHVAFQQPIYWLHHIAEIKRIMECVCVMCGACRVDPAHYPEIMQLDLDKRPNAIKKLFRKTILNCRQPDCTWFHPVAIKLQNMASVVAEYKRATDLSYVLFTPTMVLALFKQIPDSVCAFIGCDPVFSRPENLICQAFPVPPPQMRPSTKGGDSQRKSDDDITHLLHLIVQENNDIKRKTVELEASDPQSTVDVSLQNLARFNEESLKKNAIVHMTTKIQYLTGAIVENKFRGTETPMQRPSGEVYSSIKKRVDGKQGRVRKNLGAKRVDVSARSVISGDPNIGVRKVGIPRKIANHLTRPVLVNRRNRDALQAMLDNRFATPVRFPNVQHVTRRNREGKQEARHDMILSVGDTVFRTTRDGDLMLVNRAPSLHKMSLQGHSTKVMAEGDTIRIPPNVTPGYNADFDGDEMNVHVPQSIAAETELRGKASVAYNIMNPASNAPITGAVQDTMLGLSQLSVKNRTLDPLQAMRMLAKTDKTKYSSFYKTCVDKQHPRKRVRANDVITCILPRVTMLKDTNFEKSKPDKKKLLDEDAGQALADDQKSNLRIEIVDGVLKRGQFDKASIMDPTTGLLHRIITYFGHEAGAQFLDDIESVVNEFLKNNSYSIGISDVLHTRAAKNKIRDVIQKGLDEAHGLEKKVHLGNFVNETPYTNFQKFELEMMNIVKRTTDEAAQVGYQSQRREGLQEVTVDTCVNGINGMVECGSKGKKTQICEMGVLMGQQKLDGGRVKDDLDGRTLPHFTKYDLSPLARGFVVSSLADGLTPSEMNAHVKVARSGLTNTAVKTQETGYLQRKCVKFLENLQVNYDNVVRNGRKLVQTRFGDDGSNPLNQLNVNIYNLLTTTEEDMYRRFYFDDTDQERKMMFLTAEAQTDLREGLLIARDYGIRYADFLLDSVQMLVNKVFVLKVPKTVQCTVNFPDLIDTVAARFRLREDHLTSDLAPHRAMEIIESMYETRLNSLSAYCRPTDMFRILYFYYLTPMVLIYEYKFSRVHLLVLLEEVVTRYLNGLIHPGTNVGIICGQTIGSTGTQSTLNVFHSAGGMAAKSSRLLEGIPRTSEILRGSSAATPFVKAHLLPERRGDAPEISRRMERVVLRDLVNSVSVVYSPHGAAGDMDADLLRNFRRHELLEVQLLGREPPKYSARPFVFRFEVNPTLLAEKGVTMEDIDFCVRESQANVQTIYSDMNDDQLVFRVVVADFEDKQELKKSEEALLKIVIRGVEGIENVTVEHERSVMEWDGATGGFKESHDVPYLDAIGSNLSGVLAVDGVDTYRSFSNDIRMMKDVFGIESCRFMIIEELGNSILEANYSHISLLADKMTYGIDSAPVLRAGIRNDVVGPFMKASFETTSEVFYNAARRASLDDMCGLSANVICGQIGKFGTNAAQILIHPDFIETQKDIPIRTHELTGIADPESRPVELVIKYASPSLSNIPKTAFVPFDLPLLF